MLISKLVKLMRVAGGKLPASHIRVLSVTGRMRDAELTKGTLGLYSSTQTVRNSRGSNRKKSYMSDMD